MQSNFYRVRLRDADVVAAAGCAAWRQARGASSTCVGVGFARRLDLTVPVAITTADGNGGGNRHVGRVGLMGSSGPSSCAVEPPRRRKLTRASIRKETDAVMDCRIKPDQARQ
jgi:hypothetical protein